MGTQSSSVESVAQMTFSGQFGGREAVAFSLTKVLEARLPNSILYIIIERRTDEIAVQDLLKKLQNYQISFRTFETTSKFSWQLMLQLADFLRQDGVQIVHCHCYKSAFFIGLARALGKTGVKIAFTLHGLPGRFSINEAFLQLINFLSIVMADSIIGCCSDRVAPFKKIPFLRRKILTIQNGLFRGPRDAGQVSNAEKLFKDSSNVVTIGLIGRLSPEKNINLFLEAIARLKEKGLGKDFLKCFIVGEGPLLSELVNRSKELGIDKMVVFTGFVSDMEGIYSVIDLLVLTSDYEGTPMCLLEGMAHEVPLVATAVGGVVDMIEHSVNGLLFKKGNVNELTACLFDLIGDKEKRAVLGKAGFDTLREKFTPEVWCDRHIGHYEHMLFKEGRHGN